MQLELFDLSKPNRFPTWDDVNNGTAHLVYRYVPCDKCKGSNYSYWDGKECRHNAKNFAYPKSQPDGTCKRGYLEWL